MHSTPPILNQGCTGTTVDSLPKQFVAAMRTLFDIMDDQKTGYVHLTDIEQRWRDDAGVETQGLPKGVIESLRKVTPASGKLSFERFCGGLKICLIRNQAAQRSGSVENGPGLNLNQESVGAKQRSPSAPLLDMNDGISNKSQWRIMPSNNPASGVKNPATSAMVRPLETNHSISQHRALSLPQLQVQNNRPVIVPVQNKTQIRTEKEHQRLDKAGIRSALHSWHRGLLVTNSNNTPATLPTDDVILSKDSRNRGPGDGQTDQQIIPSGFYLKNPDSARKRREPRRHTLQSGVDHAALRRLRQLEHERAVLLRGLEAVDAAREWYRDRVAAVQDGMRWLGRAGARVEQWSESHQERLELQQARVMEVNRHLAALVHTWERGGLPLHMNLALAKPSHIELSPQELEQQRILLQRLKQQNRQLTEEVSRKSAAVTALEREKTLLLRELMIVQQRRILPSNPRIMTAPPSNSEEEAVF